MSWSFRSRPSARERREHELDEEIQTHFHLAIAERVERGESFEDAERAVRREFGNLMQVKEVTRGMWGGQWLDRLRQDLRFAWRGLRRSPGFALMAVATLALGVGASTAIWSLFDAILLEPLPYPQPERLVQVWETSPRDGGRSTLSGVNADVWSRSASGLAAMAAYRNGKSVTLTGDGAPQLLLVADVQPSITQVLRVEPLFGRTFTAEEAHGDGRQVVLLYPTWQRIFGGDTGVVGSTLTLDGQPFDIVGVMPEGLGFPDASPHNSIDLWMPLTVGPLGMDPTDNSHSLLAVARLRDDVTGEAAQAELAAIYRNQQAEHPEIGDLGVALVPLHEEITGDVSLLLKLLLVGVSLVLFVACGNLANLLLARAVGREREIAVRGALGAGRLRIFRQLLTESLLLGLLGGAGSLLAAPLLLRAFVAVAPADVPLIHNAAIDRDAFLFAAALSLSSVLAFGLAPALKQTQNVSRDALRSGRGSLQAGRARLRAALLVAQVSLAVVLLVGAGLLVRTFTALSTADLGFDRHNLVTFSVVLPTPRYPTPEQQNQFFDQLLDRVRAIPGVVSASGSTGSPALPFSMSFPFVIEERPARTPSGLEAAEDYRLVADDYFGVIRQPLVRGRVFTAADRADAPDVVVINQALAKKHWPNVGPGREADRHALRSATRSVAGSDRRRR